MDLDENTINCEDSNQTPFSIRKRFKAEKSGKKKLRARDKRLCNSRRKNKQYESPQVKETRAKYGKASS